MTLLTEKIPHYIAYVRQKGFFDLLSVNFLTQFLGFGSILLVAKFLTPVELGEIKILQSYTSLFVILAGFGFNTAVLKICAEDRPEQEKYGILRLGVIRTLMATGIVFALLVLLSLNNVIISSPHLSFWFIIYALTIPLSVLTGLFIVFLQAQKRIKIMARSQAIIKIQSLLLVVVSTWLWGFKGFIFATIAAFAVGLLPLLYQVGIKFLGISLDNAPQYFMRYALFSLLANGVGVLGQQGDIFVLDHFATDREMIGYYSLAVIFMIAASNVTNAVQSIVTPYFSEHAEDATWFRRQLITNQMRMVALSVVVAFGVYVGASIVVPLVYGTSYQPVLTFLAILLIKYVIWSSCAIMGSALLGIGLMHYNFVVVSITTPITLILSYLLLQQWGMIGVAWAQVFSAGLTFFLVVVAVWIAMRRNFVEHAGSLLKTLKVE
jgi:O-antigen/teichoic acid export membrane protein